MSAFSAAWIVPDGDGELDRRRPVRFRGAFRVGGAVRAAELRITACGIYRAFLNGRTIGDRVLAPEWTSYRHRHLYQSEPVGALLVEGENVLGIEVAEGWYRGRLGWKDVADHYGSEIGPLAELIDEGGKTLVATGAAWRWAPSAILSASLYDGETFDQRLDDDWAARGYDDRAWKPVGVRAFDATRLRPQPFPPVRRIEELAPIAITRSPRGATLVDFGQNLVGRTRIALPARGERTVTLRHAEVLEHGELGTRPLRSAAATDVVHTAGRAGTSWEPAFTFHGFRYVEVGGWPELSPDDLRAVVLHTDLEPIGTFACSDPRVSRLHENVRWSAKGNFVSIPTDCPQRDERLGWTGDLQVFAPTACFLFDCRTMLRSWLEDLACEQAAHGGVVPMVVPELAKLIPAVPFAGWGDAAVIVPWVLYERFGDVDVLRTQYPSMRSWVEAVAARSREDGLWCSGLQLGDWLDPAAPPKEPSRGRTDRDLVAGAYQVHCVRLLARTAEVLGEAADAALYARRADALRDAFAAEYVTPNGRLMSDSPTAYALALCFDLLAGARRDVAAQRLCKLVEADRFRIGTGFLGTPLICDALVAAGAPDHAWRLLMQTACPSWLYAVTMGATTIWERWDSMRPDGAINPGEMTSFNHYAFGAVADFLHRRVAGLAPGAPGYRVLDVQPLVGGGLAWAAATHRTPFGDAAVRWEREATRFALDVTVPEGSTARVRLPDGRASTHPAGSHRLECAVRPAADDPRPPSPEKT